MLKCLEKIVGLTQEDCACLTNGQDCDFTTSKSGLFIDQVEGGISLKGLKNVDSCKSLCDMLLKAQTIAEKRTGDDLVTALSVKFSNRKRAYIGNICQTNFTKSIAMSRPITGILVRPDANSVDSLLVIKEISVNIDATQPVTLKVIRAKKYANDGVEVASLTVNAAAGAWSKFTMSADLRLPLSINGNAVDYFFVYDRGTAKPKDNKASCGCGENERYQKQFISIYGVELNDTATLNNKSESSYGNGLTMSAEIKCDSSEFACREFDANDFISVTLAYATMYKAAELLIEEVLRSPEVSRYTMMNREYLWGKRNHFRKEYEDRIKYIANNIDPAASDCFVCRATDMLYGGIKS